MGSIADIFNGFLGFFNQLIGTGSVAANSFLETGSTAAGTVYNTVTGSLSGIVNEGV